MGTEAYKTCHVSNDLPGFMRLLAQRLRDYVSLTKPVIVVLLLVTTLAAMFVAAAGAPRLDLMVWTMVGGAFAAGGASALNQYLDRDLDSKMARTARRPVPAGRVPPLHALAFGLALSLASVVVFALFVNWAAVLLSLARPSRRRCRCRPSPKRAPWPRVRRRRGRRVRTPPLRSRTKPSCRDRLSGPPRRSTRKCRCRSPRRCRARSTGSDPTGASAISFRP